MHGAALTLDGGPRSVHEARAWVDRVCRELDRADLVDSAELAVSELVTNALLHGAPPFGLRVGGSAAHPRFEVTDASPVAPQPPAPSGDPSDDPSGDLDDLLESLTSFGRGLDLVARASAAWGADIDESGKTVWFEPAPELADRGARFRLSGSRTPEPDSDEVVVVVDDVPVAAFDRFRRHYRELHREIRLLSLAHRADFPQAAALAAYFEALEQPLRELPPAPHENSPTPGTMRVELRVAAARTREIAALATVLDAADDFCRSQRLLTLPRTEEQRAFQGWFLGEVERQLREAPAAGL